MAIIERIIPRGTVYHSLAFDLRHGAKLAVADLSDPRPLRDFERAFASHLGRAEAVLFPKARTAVWHALKALALPRGSRIVMPPITIKPMMDVVLQQGLEPIFVDIELETLCVDPEALERVFEVHAPRAILLTCLYGLVPDMKRLLGICERHGVLVLEDFSHGLNATWRGRKLGALGKLGVYSASGTKTLDTWGGGLLVTDDGALAAVLREMQAELPPPSRGRLASKVAFSALRRFASNRHVFSAATYPVLAWTRRHRPETYRFLAGAIERHREPIYAMPASWLESYAAPQARAGLELLPAVAEADRRRTRNATFLRRRLRGSGLHFGLERADSRCVWWQLVALCDRAEELQASLAARGIDTATSNLDLISESPIYPEHTLTPTPNARRLMRDGVFLPCYPDLRLRDMEQIAAGVMESCRELGLATA